MPLWPVGRLFGDARWKARLPASVIDGDPAVAVANARASLEAILHDNLVPFWIERLPRSEQSGRPFLAEERDGSLVLNLILLSRYLWFVSRLAASGHRRDGQTDLAHRCYRLLVDRLHDGKHGGFFWETNLETGVPNKPCKHLYGQAFAIYALAQFGRATGAREALDLAGATFALLEARAHDPTYGGYLEWFEADWRPAQGRGYLGWGSNVKLLNTHLHLLEAFVGLFAVQPTDPLRSRIAELVDIIAARTPSRFAVAFDGRRVDWRALSDGRNKRISYGHEVEAAYLVRLACDVTGMDPSGLDEHLRRRFGYCMRFGFDYENGGVFDHGPLGRHASSRTKVWWVQAETLLSALTLYRATRERAYLGVFEMTLGWIEKAQVDWEGGEWHREIDAAGRPQGAKYDRWKCPYHNGRAVLESLELVAALRPGAAPPAATM